MLRGALKDSVDEVLEKMFFAETLGEIEDRNVAGDFPDDEIGVRLSFEGEPPGAMCLRLTSAAARQIAADFLGLEADEISPVQVSEVVRELANMVCGSVLSRVENAAVFRLGTPQMAAPAEPPAKMPSMTGYFVQLSNGRLAVRIGTGIPAC